MKSRKETVGKGKDGNNKEEAKEIGWKEEPKRERRWVKWKRRRKKEGLTSNQEE